MKRVWIYIIALFCLLSACAVTNEISQNTQGSSISAPKETEVYEVDPEQNMQGTSESTTTETEAGEEVTEGTLPSIQDSSTPEPTAPKVYEIVPEGTPIDGFADYASIIEEYRRFAGYAVEFDDEYYMQEQVEDLDLWFNRGYMGWVIAINAIYRLRLKEDYGYAIHDLNGNGSPELLLVLGDTEVCAIFTMVGGKPKLLDEFWDKHRCEIDSTGTLYVCTPDGADFIAFASYRISQDDDELVLIDEFGICGHDMDTLEELYYKIVDGMEQKITENEFDELNNQFSDVSHSTQNSGIKIIPLFD